MPIPVVDAIAETNIALDGTVTVVDTFTLVLGTSKVAVVGQNNPAENYIYNVPASGAWARDTSAWPASSAIFPNEFAVLNGSPANNGSRWVFDNRTTPVLGTDTVSIVRWSWPRALGAGTGLTYDANAQTLDQASRGIVTGTYERVSVNSQGIVTAVFSSQSGSTELTGLRSEYDGPAALTLREGIAWVPGAGGGAGALVTVDTEINLTGLALTANTWYYVYLYEESGAGAVELSTQQPDDPYLAEARTKGGPDNVDPTVTPDLTRRFLAARRSGATANTLRRFKQDGNLVTYREDTSAAPYRVLDDGRATAYTTVDCSAVVPPTSTRALIRFSQRSAVLGDLSNSETTGSMFQIPAFTHGFVHLVDLDSLQRFQYKFNSQPNAGNGLIVDVLGFIEEV